MASLSVTEKIALEEVFVCLEKRKRYRAHIIKKYLLFYKNEFFKKKFLPIKIRRNY